MDITWNKSLAHSTFLSLRKWNNIYNNDYFKTPQLSKPVFGIISAAGFLQKERSRFDWMKASSFHIFINTLGSFKAWCSVCYVYSYHGLYRWECVGCLDTLCWRLQVIPEIWIWLHLHLYVGNHVEDILTNAIYLKCVLYWRAKETIHF